MRKQNWTGIGAGLGMLILIFDGKTALQGAQIGIELCLKTVIPSLFPFFLLSILLTKSFVGTTVPLLRPMGTLFGIPEGAESILVSAFLGGYPVGAQSIAEAFRSGQLQKEDAERMLAFCNNAGPAFLFGMVSSLFPRTWMAWALWFIQIISALLVSFLIPSKKTKPAHFSPGMSPSVSSALLSAIRVIAMVCGWVVLFRVVVSFLDRWVLWLLPVEVRTAVIGLLELSNGCCELLYIENVKLRFLICSSILAFGGICVTMQTISVTSGLSMRCYFPGKILQTLFSLLFSAVILYGTWLPCILLIPAGILLRKKQNRDSIPIAVGV